MRGRKLHRRYWRFQGCNVGYKKRIPEWGDGNDVLMITFVAESDKIKKESPNEGTETTTELIFIIPHRLL